MHEKEPSEFGVQILDHKILDSWICHSWPYMNFRAVGGDAVTIQFSDILKRLPRCFRASSFESQTAPQVTSIDLHESALENTCHRDGATPVLTIFQFKRIRTELQSKESKKKKEKNPMNQYQQILTLLCVDPRKSSSLEVDARFGFGA